MKISKGKEHEYNREVGKPDLIESLFQCRVPEAGSEFLSRYLHPFPEFASACGKKQEESDHLCKLFQGGCFSGGLVKLKAHPDGGNEFPDVVFILRRKFEQVFFKPVDIGIESQSAAILSFKNGIPVEIYEFPVGCDSRFLPVIVHDAVG